MMEFICHVNTSMQIGMFGHYAEGFIDRVFCDSAAKHLKNVRRKKNREGQKNQAYMNEIILMILKNSCKRKRFICKR